MAIPTPVNGQNYVNEQITDAVTRIRELKAAGKDEETARELELLRTAYPDYELPADLGSE